MIYIIISILLLLLLIFLYVLVKTKAQSPCKIILLGRTNAGKTVFLASMYYKFEVEVPSLGFYLDIEPKEDRQKLIEYRNQIMDASKLFPPSTLISELKEWKFNCRAKTARGICDIAQFTYLDYTGGLFDLTYGYGQQPQVGPELQVKIEKAHALVGVLDGAELLEMMEGINVTQFYHFRLQPILFFLQRTQKPCHFLITKWDLLAGKYQLGDILQRLKAYRPFTDFIENHRKVATIRLIPISALGPSYAQRQPNGEMIKNANAVLIPFQVDVALACVLFDSLYENLKRLRQGQMNWLSKVITSAPRPIALFLTLILWIIQSATLSTSGPAGLNFQFFLGGISVVDLLQTNGSSGSGPFGLARNRKEAVEQILVNFGKLLKKLDTDFPASDLTGSNTGNRP
jgi:hypothetical protein